MTPKINQWYILDIPEKAIGNYWGGWAKVFKGLKVKVTQLPDRHNSYIKFVWKGKRLEDDEGNYWGPNSAIVPESTVIFLPIKCKYNVT